jgi:hypothetical protein
MNDRSEPVRFTGDDSAGAPFLGQPRLPARANAAEGYARSSGTNVAYTAGRLAPDPVSRTLRQTWRKGKRTQKGHLRYTR